VGTSLLGVVALPAVRRTALAAAALAAEVVSADVVWRAKHSFAADSYGLKTSVQC